MTWEHSSFAYVPTVYILTYTDPISLPVSSVRFTTVHKTSPTWTNLHPIVVD